MPVEDRLRQGLRANAMALRPAVETELGRVRARGQRWTVVRSLAVLGAVAAVVGIAVALAVALGPVGSTRTSGNGPDVGGRSPLVGTFRAKVAQPARLAGRWLLEFRPDGTLRADPPAGYPGVVSGTLYSVDGSTVRTNLFAQDLCPGQPVGRYRWERRGRSLVLTAVDDPCSQRRSFLTTNAWDLSGPG